MKSSTGLSGSIVTICMLVAGFASSQLPMLSCRRSWMRHLAAALVWSHRSSMPRRPRATTKLKLRLCELCILCGTSAAHQRLSLKRSFMPTSASKAGREIAVILLFLGRRALTSFAWLRSVGSPVEVATCALLIAHREWPPGLHRSFLALAIAQLR